MVYANIVVNHTTARSSALSYLIAPDQFLGLKPGILVEVPFRSQTIEGVVLSLSKTTSSPKGKLKTIKKIISEHPVINSKQLELAKWLADYYGVSLGEAVFTILPHLNRKLI